MDPETERKNKLARVKAAKVLLAASSAVSELSLDIRLFEGHSLATAIENPREITRSEGTNLNTAVMDLWGISRTLFFMAESLAREVGEVEKPNTDALDDLTVCSARAEMELDAAREMFPDHEFPTDTAMWRDLHRKD